MLGMKKAEPGLDAGKILDGIEKAVYLTVKPCGFRRYGRSLHRFVSEDISQVIGFQLGQPHRGETHLLFVRVGIRVPECMTRSFAPEPNPKKYYHEYECNIRSDLGRIEGKSEACYDLRQPAEEIIADIVGRIQLYVLPAFEILNSRDAILEHRRAFPQLDLMNDHLILLEEAMIYGRRGDMKKASELFDRYYSHAARKQSAYHQGHLRYLEGLAKELGMEIT